MIKIGKKFRSFNEQEREDEQYWRTVSGNRKLEILEIIRAQYWAVKNETPGRFQRIYRIIKQA
ncbi:MAG: hypothetical protein JRI72_13485 [Deltaproteobacteria bacterium]|nr:hypothetical protein [Deltaproteobacteria bacterium]